MKILSRKDLEAISIRVVNAYQKLPEMADLPFYNVDPELLVSGVLGLKIGYEHLSLDRNNLGITSFTDFDIEVYDAADQPFFYALDGKTVLVEKSLRDDASKKGRFHFCLMHEGAHHILKMLFPNDYGVPKDGSPVRFYKACSDRKQPVTDWEEWQTNVLTSYILLPEYLVKDGMFMFGLGDKMQILNRLYRPKDYKRFTKLAAFLGVSKQALAIRMRGLGLLEVDQLADPYGFFDVEMG